MCHFKQTGEFNKLNEVFCTDESSIKLNCYLLLVNHALEESVSRNYMKRNEEGLCLFIRKDLQHNKVKNLIKNINGYDPGTSYIATFIEIWEHLELTWKQNETKFQILSSLHNVHALKIFTM